MTDRIAPAIRPNVQTVFLMESLRVGVDERRDDTPVRLKRASPERVIFGFGHENHPFRG